VELELADSVIDLGHVDTLPAGMAGSWIELNPRPANVEVYSYLLQLVGHRNWSPSSHREGHGRIR
jgi:hypothetical protein